MFKKFIVSLGSISFFIIIFLFFLFPIGGDGDFFHHLNTGKYVIQNLKLPQVDEFTFTAQGKEWVGYSWGVGVIFYLLYSNYGSLPINFLVSALAVATFILLYFWLRTYTVSRLIVLLSLAVAAPALSIRWPPRPEIFTYPLLISLFLIDRLKDKYPKLVFLYPGIILVWTNIYGSSTIIGLLVILILVIKQLSLDKFTIVTKHKLFYLFSFISIPFSLVNGYGLKSLFYIFYIPQISHIQSEWGGIFKGLSGPTDYLITFQYWMLIYFIYLIFFCLCSILSFKKLLSQSFLVLLGLTIFIPFFVFRQLPIAIILSTPLLGLMLSETSKYKKSILIILSFIVISVSVPLSLWADTRVLGQSEDPYSPKLIEFIKKHQLYGRVFNNQQIGGFLTYHLYPKVLVYSDTRDDLFINTEVIVDFANIFAQQTSVLPLFDKYKIDYIVGDLADGISYQSVFYSEEWAVVFLEGTYFIAMPKKAAVDKSLFISESIDPFTFSGAKKDQESEALKQYNQTLSITTESFNNKLRLALVVFSQAMYNQTIETLLSIKFTENPKKALFLADVNYLLTQSYFANGNCPNTKKYLDKTNSDAIGKFIFTPWRVIPTPVNKGYTFYYLVCEYNPIQAKKYLDLYINQADVDAAEKAMTEKQFEQLINKQ